MIEKQSIFNGGAEGAYRYYKCIFGSIKVMDRVVVPVSAFRASRFHDLIFIRIKIQLKARSEYSRAFEIFVYTRSCLHKTKSAISVM